MSLRTWNISYLPSVNTSQRRDSGWIHTLLEEAENERMHLMYVLSCGSSVLLVFTYFIYLYRRTFMTLRNPGWFFRMLILGAQGVFYNMFCTPISHTFFTIHI